MQNPSSPCYLFVRFEKSYVQTCKNSLTSTQFITDCYGGHVLGVSEHVEVVEGQWPRCAAVAVMFFKTVSGAQRWFESNPEVHQHDWLHGAEIIIVPLASAPSHRPWFLLINSQVRQADKRQEFQQEYVEVSSQLCHAMGGSAGVLSTDCSFKSRGVWDTDIIICHQWESKEDCEKWYNSDYYDTLRKKQYETAFSSDVVLFHIGPLSV